MATTHTPEECNDLSTASDTASGSGRDWFAEIENRRQRIVGLATLSGSYRAWFSNVHDAVIEGKSEKDIATKFVQLRMQIAPDLPHFYDDEGGVPVTVIVDSVATHYRIDCQLQWTFSARVDMEAV